jgi:hypothetical protein
MLTQDKVDQLIAMPKKLVETAMIEFSLAGAAKQFDALSEDGREAFVFDVNRRGKLKLSKCTYQERYAVVEILVRLDIDGPPHVNPDGADVPCPHIHVYKEGFGDKWAYPLPAGAFSNVNKLEVTFVEFLRYCNVKQIPETLLTLI